EGDAWKRQRLITQSTFKADYIAEQVPWMAALVEKHVDRWAALADRGAELDMAPEFLDLSQRVAGRYLMGSAFEGIADRFCDAAVRIKDAWPLPPKSALHALLSRSTGWNDALTAPLRDLEACFHEYLREQRKHDFADCGVLETIVHESRRQGDEFSDDSLR